MRSARAQHALEMRAVRTTAADASEQGREIRGEWSNGDPVHIIVDGKGGRWVARNLNGATWVPAE